MLPHREAAIIGTLLHAGMRTAYCALGVIEEQREHEKSQEVLLQHVATLYTTACSVVAL